MDEKTRFQTVAFAALRAAMAELPLGSRALLLIEAPECRLCTTRALYFSVCNYGRDGEIGELFLRALKTISGVAEEGE